MTSRVPPVDGPATDVAGIRVQNLLLVMRCIAAHGPIARRDVAARTGLSKSALTILTADLGSRGLIRELAGPTRASGRGRPLSLLVLDGSADAVLAVEIRLEDLLVEAADLGGARRYRAVVKHGRPMNDPGAMADRIALALAAAWQALAAEGVRVRRICLVVAAPVVTAAASGTGPLVPTSVDFGWLEPVDLRALVHTRLAAALAIPLDVPIAVENDAAMAALAEHEAFTRPPGTMVYLKSNTGIGGAAFVGGTLLRGASGMAFEPGHMVVDANGPRCACGQRGCLATVAGPEVILAKAGLSEAAANDGSRQALRQLVHRWRAGETAARAAVEYLLGWLVPAITQLRVLFDPDRVVLGGYWSGLVPAVRERLDLELRVFNRSVIWAQDVVRPAQRGEGAAAEGSLLGARWLACADLVSGPPVGSR